MNRLICGLVCLSSVCVAATRTICGKNDMEDMVTLNAAMNEMGHPIGNLRGKGMSCTGTLVAPDVFLTARHCKIACSSLTVTFGYLTRGSETFKCKEIIEYGSSNSNQDYMFVRLEGSPGVNWGYYPLSDKPLTPGTELLIIHHPSGDPMKVSRKNCQFQNEAGGLNYYSCDTEPGSSGRAVMVPDYENPENTRVVSVHAFGGCNSSSSQYNSGPAVRSLATFSAAVRAHLKN